MMSAIRSSGCSSPQLIRTVPGVMPLSANPPRAPLQQNAPRHTVRHDRSRRAQSDPTDAPLQLTLLDATPRRETKSLNGSAVRRTARWVEACHQWACDRALGRRLAERPTATTTGAKTESTTGVFGPINEPPVQTRWLVPAFPMSTPCRQASEHMFVCQEGP